MGGIRIPLVHRHCCGHNQDGIQISCHQDHRQKWQQVHTGDSLFPGTDVAARIKGEIL